MSFNAYCNATAASSSFALEFNKDTKFNNTPNGELHVIFKKTAVGGEVSYPEFKARLSDGATHIDLQVTEVVDPMFTVDANPDETVYRVSYKPETRVHPAILQTTNLSLQLSDDDFATTHVAEYESSPGTWAAFDLNCTSRRALNSAALKAASISYVPDSVEADIAEAKIEDTAAAATAKHDEVEAAFLVDASENAYPIGFRNDANPVQFTITGAQAAALPLGANYKLVVRMTSGFEFEEPTALVGFEKGEIKAVKVVGSGIDLTKRTATPYDIANSSLGHLGLAITSLAQPVDATITVNVNATQPKKFPAKYAEVTDGAVSAAKFLALSLSNYRATLSSAAPAALAVGDVLTSLASDLKVKVLAIAGTDLTLELLAGEFEETEDKLHMADKHLELTVTEYAAVVAMLPVGHNNAFVSTTGYGAGVVRADAYFADSLLSFTVSLGAASAPLTTIDDSGSAFASLGDVTLNKMPSEKQTKLVKGTYPIRLVSDAVPSIARTLSESFKFAFYSAVDASLHADVKYPLRELDGFLGVDSSTPATKALLETLAFQDVDTTTGNAVPRDPTAIVLRAIDNDVELVIDVASGNKGKLKNDNGQNLADMTDIVHDVDYAVIFQDNLEHEYATGLKVRFSKFPVEASLVKDAVLGLSSEYDSLGTAKLLVDSSSIGHYAFKGFTLTLDADEDVKVTPAVAYIASMQLKNDKGTHVALTKGAEVGVQVASSRYVKGKVLSINGTSLTMQMLQVSAAKDFSSSSLLTESRYRDVIMVPRGITATGNLFYRFTGPTVVVDHAEVVEGTWKVWPEMAMWDESATPNPAGVPGFDDAGKWNISGTDRYNRVYDLGTLTGTKPTFTMLQPDPERLGIVPAHIGEDVSLGTELKMNRGSLSAAVNPDDLVLKNPENPLDVWSATPASGGNANISGHTATTLSTSNLKERTFYPYSLMKHVKARPVQTLDVASPVTGTADSMFTAIPQFLFTLTVHHTTAVKKAIAQDDVVVSGGVEGKVVLVPVPAAQFTAPGLTTTSTLHVAIPAGQRFQLGGKLTGKFGTAVIDVIEYTAIVAPEAITLTVAGTDTFHEGDAVRTDKGCLMTITKVTRATNDDLVVELDEEAWRNGLLPTSSDTLYLVGDDSVTASINAAPSFSLPDTSTSQYAATADGKFVSIVALDAAESRVVTVTETVMDNQKQLRAVDVTVDAPGGIALADLVRSLEFARQGDEDAALVATSNTMVRFADVSNADDALHSGSMVLIMEDGETLAPGDVLVPKARRVLQVQLEGLSNYDARDATKRIAVNDVLSDGSTANTAKVLSVLQEEDGVGAMVTILETAGSFGNLNQVNGKTVGLGTSMTVTLQEDIDINWTVTVGASRAMASLDAREDGLFIFDGASSTKHFLNRLVSGPDMLRAGAYTGTNNGNMNETISFNAGSLVTGIVVPDAANQLRVAFTTASGFEDLGASAGLRVGYASGWVDVARFGEATLEVLPQPQLEDVAAAEPSDVAVFDPVRGAYVSMGEFSFNDNGDIVVVARQAVANKYALASSTKYLVRLTYVENAAGPRTTYAMIDTTTSSLVVDAAGVAQAGHYKFNDTADAFKLMLTASAEGDDVGLYLQANEGSLADLVPGALLEGASATSKLQIVSVTGGKPVTLSASGRANLTQLATTPAVFDTFALNDAFMQLRGDSSKFPTSDLVMQQTGRDDVLIVIHGGSKVTLNSTSASDMQALLSGDAALRLPGFSGTYEMYMWVGDALVPVKDGDDTSKTLQLRTAELVLETNTHVADLTRMDNTGGQSEIVATLKLYRPADPVAGYPARYFDLAYNSAGTILYSSGLLAVLGTTPDIELRGVPGTITEDRTKALGSANIGWTSDAAVSNGADTRPIVNTLALKIKDDDLQVAGLYELHIESLLHHAAKKQLLGLPVPGTATLAQFDIAHERALGAALLKPGNKALYYGALKNSTLGNSQHLFEVGQLDRTGAAKAPLDVALGLLDENTAVIKVPATQALAITAGQVLQQGDVNLDVQSLVSNGTDVFIMLKLQNAADAINAGANITTASGAVVFDQSADTMFLPGDAIQALALAVPGSLDVLAGDYSGTPLNNNTVRYAYLDSSSADLFLPPGDYGVFIEAATAPIGKTNFAVKDTVTGEPLRLTVKASPAASGKPMAAITIDSSGTFKVAEDLLFNGFAHVTASSVEPAVARLVDAASGVIIPLTAAGGVWSGTLPASAPFGTYKLQARLLDEQGFAWEPVMDVANASTQIAMDIGSRGVRSKLLPRDLTLSGSTFSNVYPNNARIQRIHVLRPDAAEPRPPFNALVSRVTIVSGTTTVKTTTGRVIESKATQIQLPDVGTSMTGLDVFEVDVELSVGSDTFIMENGEHLRWIDADGTTTHDQQVVQVSNKSILAGAVQEMAAGGDQLFQPIGSGDAFLRQVKDAAGRDIGGAYRVVKVDLADSITSLPKKDELIAFPLANQVTAGASILAVVEACEVLEADVSVLLAVRLDDADGPLPSVGQSVERGQGRFGTVAAVMGQRQETALDVQTPTSFRPRDIMVAAIQETTNDAWVSEGVTVNNANVLGESWTIIQVIRNTAGRVSHIALKGPATKANTVLQAGWTLQKAAGFSSDRLTISSATPYAPARPLGLVDAAGKPLPLTATEEAREVSLDMSTLFDHTLEFTTTHSNVATNAIIQDSSNGNKTVMAIDDVKLIGKDASTPPKYTYRARPQLTAIGNTTVKIGGISNNFTTKAIFFRGTYLQEILVTGLSAADIADIAVRDTFRDDNITDTGAARATVMAKSQSSGNPKEALLLIQLDAPIIEKGSDNVFSNGSSATIDDFRAVEAGVQLDAGEYDIAVVEAAHQLKLQVLNSTLFSVGSSIYYFCNSSGGLGKNALASFVVDAVGDGEITVTPTFFNAANLATVRRYDADGTLQVQQSNITMLTVENGRRSLEYRVRLQSNIADVAVGDFMEDQGMGNQDSLAPIARIIDVEADPLGPGGIVTVRILAPYFPSEYMYVQPSNGTFVEPVQGISLPSVRKPVSLGKLVYAKPTLEVDLLVAGPLGAGGVPIPDRGAGFSRHRFETGSMLL